MRGREENEPISFFHAEVLVHKIFESHNYMFGDKSMAKLSSLPSLDWGVYQQLLKSVQFMCRQPSGIAKWLGLWTQDLWVQSLIQPKRVP